MCNHWFIGCILPYRLRVEAKTGVHFDNAIRHRCRIQRAASGSCGCSQEEAWLATAADHPVHDLLWSDDHAHRRAGPDDRIAARVDSRTIPRQHRVIRRKAEGPRGRACRTGGHSTKPVVPDSVHPGSVDLDPVRPYSVNPGAKPPGPVIPGRTTRACADPDQAQVAISDAIKASL